MRSIADLNRSLPTRTLSAPVAPVRSQLQTPTVKPLDTFEGPTGAGATATGQGATQNQQIVAHSYQRLLLREPDAGGLEHWTGVANELTAKGASETEVRTAIDTAMRASPEFQAIDVVQRSFAQTLGRTPTERGYWHEVALEMQVEGSSIEQIASTVQSAHRQSDEYKLGHPEETISNLYQRHLMREPDSAGMQTWTAEYERMKASEMSAGDIEAVLSGKIRESDEHQSVQLVNRVFQEELGRTPEAKGTWHELALQMRAEGRGHGDIEAHLRAEIQKSHEWMEKHPQAPTNSGAQTWVGRVPEINQNNPVGNDGNYWNGSSNCGPASLAMIARAVGYRGDLDDADLVMNLYRLANTDGDNGTGVPNMEAALQKMGLQTETSWHSANVDKMAAQLEAGNMIVANGDFYALGVPGRANSSDAGHYIVVEGMDGNGNFIINEPWDGRQYSVSRGQMQQFLLEWPGARGVGGNWIAARP